MTRVRIPPMLRPEVGGARQLEADGETVGEVIENLVEQYPQLRAQLFENGDPSARSSTSISAARTSGRSRASRPPCGTSATVILLPAMAGGNLGSKPASSA